METEKKTIAGFFTLTYEIQFYILFQNTKNPLFLIIIFLIVDGSFWSGCDVNHR